MAKIRPTPFLSMELIRYSFKIALFFFLSIPLFVPFATACPRSLVQYCQYTNTHCIKQGQNFLDTQHYLSRSRSKFYSNIFYLSNAAKKRKMTK